MNQDSPLYRVIFVSQDEVFEVYARQVFASELQGFIEIEELVFGSPGQRVVDPAEERLKSLFADVKRSFIPYHALVRIDEVAQAGTGKVTEVKGAVAQFPLRPSGRRDY